MSWTVAPRPSCHRLRISNTKHKTITTAAPTDQTTTDRTHSKPGTTDDTRTGTHHNTRTHSNRPTQHLANNRGSMDYLLCSTFELLAPDLCEPRGLQPLSLIHKPALFLIAACKWLLLLLRQLTVPQPVAVAAQVHGPVRDRTTYVHDVLAPVTLY
jgi:hypothetical protein